MTIAISPYGPSASMRYTDGSLHLSSLQVEILACAIDTLWKHVAMTTHESTLQELLGTYAYRSMTQKEQVAPQSQGLMAQYLLDVARIGTLETPIDEVKE